MFPYIRSQSPLTLIIVVIMFSCDGRCKFIDADCKEMKANSTHRRGSLDLRHPHHPWDIFPWPQCKIQWTCLSERRVSLCFPRSKLDYNIKKGLRQTEYESLDNINRLKVDFKVLGSYEHSIEPSG
jgi:hypothetical protein